MPAKFQKQIFKIVASSLTLLVVTLVIVVSSAKAATPPPMPPTMIRLPLLNVVGSPALRKLHGGKVHDIAYLTAESQIINNDSAEIIAEASGATRDLNVERQITNDVIKLGLVDTNTRFEVRLAIVNFITYGTVTTAGLGSKEREGIILSYKTAYKHLPQMGDDWLDVIKISNGRFPNEQNKDREKIASQLFKKIYRRLPDLNQQNDKEAVMIMAYGLRITPINMSSEHAALNTFMDVFRRKPSTISDWSALRAIAYSGAKR